MVWFPVSSQAMLHKFYIFSLIENLFSNHRLVSDSKKIKSDDLQKTTERFEAITMQEKSGRENQFNLGIVCLCSC